MRRSSITCQPNVPVPQELLDILHDEDEIIDHVEGEVEEVEDIDEQVDVANMPTFIEDEFGCLQPAGGDAPEPVAPSDSEDEEWEEAHRLRESDMSPLTSPVRSPVRSQLSGSAVADASIPAVVGVSGAPADSFGFRLINPDPVARGRTSRRGRGWGRVRGWDHGTGRDRGTGLGRETGRPVRMARNERLWMRGQPLEEVYGNDVDLPPNIREQIQRQEWRAMNERRVNEEEMNDEEEYEDALNEGFEWRGMNDWRGMKENFIPHTTGPTQNFTSAYEAMHAIWTDDIMAHIAHESNRYAQSNLVQRARFARDWFETNLNEMWILFAFWIMLGIIRMPSIKSCFTHLPLLKTNVFRSLFTEERYWNLNAAFHLASESNPNDPLSPMGPVIDHLNAKFKELYRLDQNICIDESLTLWKGPVGFKQYIKTKSARFGIKTYQLCESATGYLWSFFVYVGRATVSGSLPPSVSTVLKLIRPLLNLGHTLFMDNWFNSPNLARWLKRRKTDCVGTLRTSRKNVPSIIRQCPLREGEFVARASDDVMVVAIHDRRHVACISTYHDVSQVLKAERQGHSAQHKLKLIDDYNHGMGGVDRMDQILEAYLVERKQCLKWNKKLFKKLLNISIQNSRIMLEKSTDAKIDSLAFRLALVQEIIAEHKVNVPSRPSTSTSTSRTRYSAFPMNRLTDRHFISRILITEDMRQNVAHRTNWGRRVCVWCTANERTRSRTVYECRDCNVPLCLEICFKEFHTIK